MSQNLSRVTGKIFAGNASQNVVGQFGSALVGTKVNTTDIATIQGLSAYTNGWSSAVLTDRNYPTLEEMNGVMRVMSYQTAYTLQKGMPEWDSATTYFLGDMCKGIGEGKIYKSKVNNNIGNEVTDTVFWEEFTGATTVTLPATNYVAHLDGNPTYSGMTVSMPATTYYIPNGRSGDNTLNNTIKNVPATTYTVSGSNGTYTLFYNDNTEALHLAPHYTVRAAANPTDAVFNDVCYLLNNRMYMQETLAPNYTLSTDVNVTSAGIVSKLGTLTFNNPGSIPANPTINLKFTTGSDITTAQSLFSTPYAVGSVSNGSVNIALYSYSYGVSYNPQLYTGAYTLLGQVTTYMYSMNNSIYYSEGALAVGTELYNDPDLTELYGTVSVLTDSYIAIVDSTEEDLYSGTYEDISSTTYTYSLGSQYIYSSALLTTGLIVYTNSSLSDTYGVIESLTSSRVVVHSIDTALGYVDTTGTGRVASGISIYSDINLTNFIQTSTGLNASYADTSYKSLISNLSMAVAANTTYEGQLIQEENAYTLTLNNTSTSIASTRSPYNEAESLYLGGSSGFLGTVDLTGTSIPNVWTWNGRYISTLDWAEEPLCKIGKITITGGAISALDVDYPIEIFKMSDFETMVDPKLEELQALINTKLTKSGDTITGKVYAPTPAVGTNNTQIATTAFVKNNIPYIRNINYAGAITVTLPLEASKYTAPSDGVYYANVGVNNGTRYLYINGTARFTYYDGAERTSFQTFFVPLSKGDVIYWSGSLSQSSAPSSVFYPYKS